MSRDKYAPTITACFIGYIVQAIVNNFAPLLFLTFESQYGIPLEKITLLITINFGVQLTVDMLSVYVVDKIGYRASALIAHGLSAAGLAALAFLPDIMPDRYAGLLIAVIIYAVGGGLLEVIISPMVEACPTANKERAMSMLHSFYCWGHVGVVIISTAFFAVFGIQNWKLMALVWALVPALNAIFFARVPIARLTQEGERGMGLKALLGSGAFWLLMLLMVCSGASEQAVSQWASAFAESGLGVGKTMGDLAGPMLFAVMMGLSRVFYGKFGEKIALKNFMLLSGALCVVSYLVISLSPVPALGFAGCALCGLSVGIMWPGTFSMAASSLKVGGTALFALLALAGDVGCSAGPTLVGFVSGAASGDLKTGILAALVFPVLFIIGMTVLKKSRLSDNAIK